MSEEDAAVRFREAVARHEEEYQRREEAGRKLMRAKAERASILQPMVEAIRQSMRELALVEEYGNVMGRTVESVCDGSHPTGVPLDKEEIPRADAWVVSFPPHEKEQDPDAMPPLATIVGICLDEQAMNANLWVHVVDSNTLAAFRWAGERIAHLFEEGTMVAHSPLEASKQVVSFLVEDVAYRLVRLRANGRPDQG